MVYIEDKVLLTGEDRNEPNPKKCFARDYRGRSHTPFFPLTTYYSGHQDFHLRGCTHFMGPGTLVFRGAMCGDPE